jgi:hypothetical protein
MTGCPIFAAARFMDLVQQEMEHLATVVVEELAEAKIECTFQGDDVHPEDFANQRVAWIYGLSKAYKNQRVQAQLVLYFDLARPEGDGDWPPGQAAILVVAYEPKLTSGWERDQLTFSTAGKFYDPQAAKTMTLAKGTRNKLLVWGNKDTRGWQQTGWAFGVEMNHLKNRDIVDEMVIHIVKALLSNDLNVLKAIMKTDLVVWPSF